MPVTPTPAASGRRSFFGVWLWVLLGLAALLTVCLGCGGLLLLGYGLPAGPTPVPPEPVATATPQPTATASPTQPPTPTPTAAAMDRVPFRAVVQIVALDADGEPLWSGSGSIISPDGLILTNAHIVLPDRGEPEVATLLVLLTEHEDRPPRPRFYAEVLQADPNLDLAVLRIARDLDGQPVRAADLNLPYLPLGDPADLRLGDELTILGYPGIGGNTITLTKGEVAGFIEEAPYGPRAYIKTTATLAGGNSGGAALNTRGELVAVPTRFGVDAEEVVDCRVLVDTNQDGVIDDRDACVPIGGFINALRPVNLAEDMITAARRGEVALPTPPPARGGLAEIWRHPGPVLDADDLDAPVPGWITDADDPDTRIRYQDGAMVVEILTPFFLHTLTSPVDAADVVVTVQVRVTRTVEGGDFGLLCRYRDIDNFYSAGLTADGYYYMAKMVAGEFTALREPTRLPKAAAFTPNQWNAIGLICFGPHLALWVNDHPVAMVSDTSLTQPGDAGLFVGTVDDGGFEVAFDAFQIRDARRR